MQFVLDDAGWPGGSFQLGSSKPNRTLVMKIDFDHTPATEVMIEISGSQGGDVSRFTARRRTNPFRTIGYHFRVV